MDNHWDNLTSLVEELAQEDGAVLDEGAFSRFVQAFKRILFGKKREQDRKEKSRDKAETRKLHHFWRSKKKPAWNSGSKKRRFAFEKRRGLARKRKLGFAKKSLPFSRKRNISFDRYKYGSDSVEKFARKLKLAKRRFHQSGRDRK